MGCGLWILKPWFHFYLLFLNVNVVLYQSLLYLYNSKTESFGDNIEAIISLWVMIFVQNIRFKHAVTIVCSNNTNNLSKSNYLIEIYYIVFGQTH